MGKIVNEDGLLSPSHFPHLPNLLQVYPTDGDISIPVNRNSHSLNLCFVILVVQFSKRISQLPFYNDISLSLEDILQCEHLLVTYMSVQGAQKRFCKE